MHIDLLRQTFSFFFLISTKLVALGGTCRRLEWHPYPAMVRTQRRAPAALRGADGGPGRGGGRSVEGTRSRGRRITAQPHLAVANRASSRGAGAGEARVRVVRRAAWHLALEVRRRRAARRAAASANLLRPSAHLACVFPNEESGSQKSPNKGPARTRERAHDCAYSRSGALGACLRICTRNGHVAAAHALGVVWRNVMQCWLRMG